MGLGFPEAYGGTEGDRFMRIIAMQEIGARGLRRRRRRAVQPYHRRAADPAPRVGGDEGAGAAADPLGRENLGAGDHRTVRRLRRRQSAHAPRGATAIIIVVNGSKTFITSGMRADFITLAARTGGPGASGVSLILIEGQPEGLQRTSLKKMGWWCSDTATLYFENVRVPAENLIGKEGEGFRAIMLNFNDERLHGAAGAISAARVCLEEAIAMPSSARPLASRSSSIRLSDTNSSIWRRGSKPRRRCWNC